MGATTPPSSTNSAEEVRVPYCFFNFQKLSLLSQLDWIPVVWLSSSVLFAFIGLVYCEYHLKTFLLAFFFYYIGGIGITSGYHRLWSHRSYQAALPAKLVLLFMGTSSFEGWQIMKRYLTIFKVQYLAGVSITEHIIAIQIPTRIHTTLKEAFSGPTSVGLFGNDLKQNIKIVHAKKQDSTTFTMSIFPIYLQYILITKQHLTPQDPILQFQHRYYALLAISSGILLPAYIAGVYWNDFLGGLLIAGFAKSVFLQHATFFINSLAHTWGDSTYTEQHSAKDSYLVSIFTFGEGYHNFHHEFPYDYRNGLEWFHYDPGKWLIRGMSYVGLAWDLKRFRNDLFWKGKNEILKNLVFTGNRQNSNETKRNR